MADLRTALGQESAVFQSANHDFALIMKATEKNPNVLQCCQRASEYCAFMITCAYIKQPCH